MSCYEIAAAVFECLSPGPRLMDDDPRPNKRRRKTAQRTLASAARVCHAFSSPALDVLWRIVDDIVHLLEIFPSFRKELNQNRYVSTCSPFVCC